MKKSQKNVGRGALTDSKHEEKILRFRAADAGPKKGVWRKMLEP